MSFRVKKLTLVALYCAMMCGLYARADFAKTNPVTGESESYTWKYVGDDNNWDDVNNWKDSSNANPSAVPGKTDGNVWDPFLFDGSDVNINANLSVEGWLLRMGLYDGAKVTVNNLKKIQSNASDMWITVDGSSKLTIAGYGDGHFGNSKVCKLSVAAENGIEWTDDFGVSAGSTANNTMEYYLAGPGSVAYQAVSAGTHKIKMADVTLTGGAKAVTNKTLVTFTSTTQTFTADATIKLKNSIGDVVASKSLQSVTSGATTLTTADRVGACELVQTSTGILLYYVDGDPAETAYTPSININFTNGSVLTTTEDVGLAGYDVPGTSWNNFTVPNNSNTQTYDSVNKIDASGATSVADGVTVTVSDHRGSYNCSGLTSSNNPLYGYVDDGADKTTPTVTINNVPYAYYRVIVYHSTDTANAKFGYDTINGTNFTYVDGEQAVGTSSWGDAGPDWSANPIEEGVNTLVSGILTGSTITFSANRMSGSERGTFAAIQVVEVAVDAGVLIIPVAGDTEFTVPENKSYDKVIVSGTGTVTLTGSGTITTDELEIEKSSAIVMNESRLVATTVIGEGTAVYDGAKPPTGKGWDDVDNWKGTVWVKNIPASSKSEWDLANYGNANSTLRFTGVNLFFPNNTTATFQGTVDLDGDGLNICDGYGNSITTIARLTGNGTLSTSKASSYGNGLIINDASGFTGTITLTFYRVVIGTETGRSSNGALWIDSAGVTIPSGRTWTAPGGVVVTTNGTLTVAGTLAATAGVTVNGELTADSLTKVSDGNITLGNNGVFTVTSSGNVNEVSSNPVDYSRVKGTGTLKFSSTSGWRTFPDDDEKMPATTVGIQIELADGLIITKVGETVIGSLSGTKGLRSDWGAGSRTLTVTQSKDTTWSGKFLTERRISTLNVTGTGTLTLAGTHDTSPAMNVIGSVNLTGKYVGATTVTGAFGGTGTLDGNLTFQPGATLKVFTLSDALHLADGRTITYPDGDDKIAVDLSAIDLEGVGYIPLLRSNTTEIDTNKFVLANTSLPLDFQYENGELGLVSNSNLQNIYRDRVTFILNNIGSTPVANYTLLVRISEKQIPGFKYSRAGDGSKIAFADNLGAPLPFDIDTWNAGGESIVWVKVPEAVDGKKVTFYWSLKDGETAPANEPTAVWSDYAAVWHMTDATDSTANYAEGTLNSSVAVSKSGLFGKSLGANKKTGGPFMRATATDAMTDLVNDSFTVSFWACLNAENSGSGNATGWPMLFARRADHDGSGYALRIAANSVSSAKTNVRTYYGVGNGSGSAYVQGDAALTTEEWQRYDVVYNSNSVQLYLDGSLAYSQNTSTKPVNGEDKFAIGGWVNKDTEGTLLGAIDEFRLRPGAIDTTRIGAERANASQTDYLSATIGDSKSFLVPGTVFRNGVAQDYWMKAPSITPSSWEKSDNPPTVTFTAGLLRSGAGVTVVCETAAGVYVTDDVSSASLGALDIGAYRVRCYRTDDGSEVEVEDAIVDFTIVKPSGVGTVGDSSSGRILLMNNDWTYGGGASDPQIAGQGWANTNATSGTFWQHLNDTEGSVNIMPGTESEMLSVDGAVTNTLWRLVNCRHGNTFTAAEVAVDDTTGLDDTQNYLPSSVKSASIKNTGEFETTRDGVGQILMQNRTDAIVYSPVYTNGIGTIYFDAVNGWNNNLAKYDGGPSGDESNTNSYQLVVQISTEAAEVESVDIPDEAWTTVESHVVRVSASAPMSEVAATGNVVLDVADGGTMNEFYIIYAPVENRGTVRFRIRRTGMDSSAGADAGAYILLDNIIVSYPRMAAELKPSGQYFSKKRKDVLGVEGAFADSSNTAILPTAGDEVYGRAIPQYYVNASTNLVETNFIASARMHYRWRYLNQLVGEWRVTALDPENGFRSMSALTLPATVGDVEFWFDATLQTPYYRYVDYSGKNLADEFLAIYTENVVSVTNTASAAESDKYPSTGSDWFVRLREGASAFESVYLHTSDGTVCETNSMQLTASGQWRGFVKTMSEVEGGLDFRFEGVKLTSASAGSVTFETNRWTAVSEALSELPASRGVEPGDGWQKAKCDAKTGYLVFTYDETRETITICRGDYQDFNMWSSADTSSHLFVGSSIDTNSTTDVAQEYVAGIADWSVSQSTSPNWSEDFSVEAGQRAEVIYPRDVPISYAQLSNENWTVENASWTFQKWACSFDDKGFGGQSALQLEGRGKGRLSYVSESNYPDGLEAISFTSRVAQFNEFSDFAYYEEGTNTSTDTIYFPSKLKNYTFVTYGALTLDADNFNFDGDGSLSLIAYFDRSYGAYEARVSRSGVKGNTLRFVLLKWYNSGSSMACEVLGTNEFTHVSVDGLMRTNGNLSKLCRLYISVQEYTTAENITGTMLHAGISSDVTETDASYTPGTMSSIEYETNVYFDASPTRLKSGTFGVLTRNCPGAFINPVFLNKGITGIGTGDLSSYTVTNTLNRYQSAFGDTTVHFAGDATGSFPDMTGTYTTKEENRTAWYDTWALPPGRTNPYTDNPNYWGFTGITNVYQTIAVQTTAHGGSSWQTVTNIVVDSFMSKTNTCYIYSHTPCDVRLQVGGGPNDPRLDVTVDDIKLSKWNGEWTKNYDTDANRAFPSNYVYTSAWIVQDDDEIAQKAVRLQPARAETATTPVSLRTPVMNGAGLFHINWRNADTSHTRLLLQKCTIKNLENNLRALTKASISDSRWKTIETINITEESGAKTFFLNERYDGEQSTVLRLIVDPEVVAAARASDDKMYGSVEITDAYVWDLPPYDKRSWSGWNFRTDGWRDSTDTMWANLTDYSSGLSGLLNNTLDPSTLDEPTRVDAYRGHMPYVQSPTFETNCIGSVEFRARLYDPVADEIVGYPALVTVYGAKRENIDSDTGEPRIWTKLADIEVSSTVYETKAAKFKSGDQYCVLRFSVKGVKDVTPPHTETIDDGDTEVDPDHNPPLRVALDDICIFERPAPSIRFRKNYVRPFRNADAIKTLDPVLDIATSAEQPIIGETFGFQAEIEVNDLENDVVIDDPTMPIRVYVAYYPYADSWGWENWISKTNASDGAAISAELVAAEGTNFVYRSTLDDAKTMCPAQLIGDDKSLRGNQPYRLVQYQFFVTYYDREGIFHTQSLDSDQWSMPEWNWGFTNPNNGKAFSAFTLLETLAPKQAWINEVNLAENGTQESRTNQWLEVAIPTGVDMKGWSVRYYNTFNKDEPLVGTLFYFGGGNAATAKNETADSGHYSFYVAKSPQTTSISSSDAHATWDRINGKQVDNGFLPYGRPAGFELVRASGVVEHSVVIQGYNEWENTGNEDAARAASGTNFIETVLKPVVGGDWVWGEEDKYAYVGHTAGVTNNMGGAHEDWYSPMKPTPGAININQTIDPSWYILPNGGYYRIYSILSGDHISQNFGGDTSRTAVATVTEGSSTNIIFYVDKWYKLAWSADPSDRTSASAPVAQHDEAGRITNYCYTVSLNNVSNSVTVTASADISDEVASLIPAGDEGDAYRQAIMKWLAAGVTGKGAGTQFSGDSLTNAVYRGYDGSSHETIDLVGMYWLDLDPTQAGWELWGGMGPYGSSDPTNHISAATTILREHPTWNIVHTNIQVSAWLMITNTETSVAYPPYRLQGLNNEKSDAFSGSWTSVTFKISMRLSATGNRWRDLSYFVFNDDSFNPADATDAPFTTVIEVVDPHSDQSPAVDWGWSKYPDITPWAKWKINIDSVPASPSVLRKFNDLADEYPATGG